MFFYKIELIIIISYTNIIKSDNNMSKFEFPYNDESDNESDNENYLDDSDSD